MNTSDSWKKYRAPGIIETDEELIQMMQETVDTINTLERIYVQGAEVVVRTLISDWYNLSSMARARGILDYPRIGTKQ